MKISALSYFRFKRQFHYVATEVGGYSSDVVAICPEKNRFIEVEIKVTKADLITDFKKMKHEIYLKYKDHKILPTRKWKQQWIPREFYFMVPEKLTEYAINVVEDLPYGIFEYRHPKYDGIRFGYSYEDRIKIIKKAKRLHKNIVSEQNVVMRDIISRMSSELCRSYIEFQNYKEKMS